MATISRCCGRSAVPSPCRKLSRKRSRNDPGAAHASLIAVISTVLSAVAARRSRSARSWDGCCCCWWAEVAGITISCLSWLCSPVLAPPPSVLVLSSLAASSSCLRRTS
uniref:Uncharacterized protein n=1 Tax=Arundo donax TaxID=35708 RepID=A0A0A9DFE9_ARUDO